MEDAATELSGLGERIARARLAAGYENASAFARRVGVVPNTLYRWESGDLTPDVARLAAVSRLTKVSLDWLVRGVETTTHAALTDWRETPKGQTASDAAMLFLASMPLEGYSPTRLFYDLALMAFEAGLLAPKASQVARYNESKRGE